MRIVGRISLHQICFCSAGLLCLVCWAWCVFSSFGWLYLKMGKQFWSHWKMKRVKACITHSVYSLSTCWPLSEDSRKAFSFPTPELYSHVYNYITRWGCGLVEDAVTLWPRCRPGSLLCLCHTDPVVHKLYLEEMTLYFRGNVGKLWLLTGIAVVYSICMLKVMHTQYVRYLLLLFCDRISLYKLLRLGTCGKFPAFISQVLGAIISALPSFLMWRNHSKCQNYSVLMHFLF